MGIQATNLFSSLPMLASFMGQQANYGASYAYPAATTAATTVMPYYATTSMPTTSFYPNYSAAALPAYGQLPTSYMPVTSYYQAQPMGLNATTPLGLDATGSTPTAQQPPLHAFAGPDLYRWQNQLGIPNYTFQLTAPLVAPDIPSFANLSKTPISLDISTNPELKGLIPTNPDLLDPISREVERMSYFDHNNVTALDFLNRAQLVLDKTVPSIWAQLGLLNPADKLPKALPTTS